MARPPPRLFEIEGQQNLRRIRDLVIRDPVALRKWCMVVDDIVEPGADELTVKHLLDEYHYPEAVLRTLRLWYEEHAGGLPDLLGILEHRGLRRLAVQVRHELVAPADTDVAPIWFEVGEVPMHFVGRQVQLARLHVLLTTTHSTQSSAKNIVSLCGLGGMGKSSIARKYAHNQRTFYAGNVIWINAESLDSIRASFSRLARRLGLGEVSESETEAKALAKLVYEKFWARECLFIFDNVEDKAHLNQFRPRITDPSKCTPHVLVTARTRNVIPVPENELVLQGFDGEEILQLIQKQLINCTVGGAQKLGKTLQYFPLALQQALAYIQQILGDDDDAIDEYLREFEASLCLCLDDELFQENEDYALTTF